MPVYKDEKRGTFYSSFVYIDWTGTKCRKFKRGFKTRREALEWERSFLVKDADDLDMTFKDFYELYTSDIKPRLKLNTWITKDTIVKNRIMPYFQKRRINEISQRDIVKWQNELLGAKKPNGEPFSDMYLKTYQSQLSAIFNHAVRFYDLKNNPVHKVDPITTKGQKEMLFWTKEEYMKFVECVADKPYTYYAFEMLYWCGIRLGELLALTPADFDFEKKQVSITKSYQHLQGEDIITPPKTAKSVRVISLPDNVAIEMKQY